MMMSLFNRGLRKKKIKISSVHSQDIDPFYSDVDIEQIGIYQNHFNRIIEKVDIENYTKWSKSKEFNRSQLDSDDEWMYEQLIKAEKDGINGALLQNIVNQYFFADTVLREYDKPEWVYRVVHRKHSEDYFPDGQSLRKLMELLSL